MIKAVIFDLDDTLISEKEYIKSGFRIVASKISYEHQLDESAVYKTMWELFEEDSKAVFNRLLDTFDVQYDTEYINKLIYIYRNHMPNIKLYDDAKEIIEYLYSNKVKLGIITDGYKITQRNKLQVLNIDKYFECVVVTDELGREYWKPHRKSYDIVKGRLGMEYNEMVYVGDNITKDFITANKLGIHTILINREEGIYCDIDKSDEYHAKNSIPNLNELINILESNKVWSEI